MILVTGVSWDLSSPESDSNNGVCDAHDDQWETVHQYNDNNVVPEIKKTTTKLICWRAYWDEIVGFWIHAILSHNLKS